MVPSHGFEPRYSGPKPDVLPLDDDGKKVAGLIGFEPMISGSTIQRFEPLS